MTNPVRVGVIGLGFMGGVHLRALRAAEAAGAPVRTVAVWDRHPERRAGGGGVSGNITSTEGEPLYDPTKVRVSTTLETFLDDPDLDLVSICTPTDTHIPLMEAVIDAGKHVIIEKPVALDANEIERVSARAKEARVIVCPAMCMRFWPAWPWLKEAITDERYGALQSLHLLRVGGAPQWSSDFYLDPTRSGDAIVDLHIHDVDFVHWLFGPPRAVRSTGSTRHLQTTYDVGGPWVVAEGGWFAPGGPFRMRYRAAFERAVAEFDIGGDPSLTVFHADGEEHPELPEGDGYDGELRHIVEAIAAGKTPDLSLGEAAAVMRTIDAERESLASGGAVSVTPNS